MCTSQRTCSYSNTAILLQNCKGHVVFWVPHYFYWTQNHYSWFSKVASIMSPAINQYTMLLPMLLRVGLWEDICSYVFQGIVIHTVKGFGIVNKAEIDVFLEFSCFFHDPADVGNWISGSSAFSSSIWKVMVHALLKPGLENFEH